MAEIKTPPIELVPGEMYEAKDGCVVFTEDHTFADIIRWLISEGCDKKEAMYHYNREVEEMDGDFTQSFDPIRKQWVKVDTRKGEIIGRRNTPWKNVRNIW